MLPSARSWYICAGLYLLGECWLESAYPAGWPARFEREIPAHLNLRRHEPPGPAANPTVTTINPGVQLQDARTGRPERKPAAKQMHRVGRRNATGWRSRTAGKAPQRLRPPACFRPETRHFGVDLLPAVWQAESVFLPRLDQPAIGSRCPSPDAFRPERCI